VYRSNPQTLRLSLCSVSGNENLVVQKVREGKGENYFTPSDAAQVFAKRGVA
jgi:hypothetical protein